MVPSQSYGISSNRVWMWELDHKEAWTPKNWCFWTMVLKKILESPLNCKEIKPVNPKGNQSWIFIGRTNAEAEAQILWPPDARNWLIGKDPDTGKEGKRRRWLDAITQWTWVWTSSMWWWRTGKAGVLQFMGSQRVRYPGRQQSWKDDTLRPSEEVVRVPPSSDLLSPWRGGVVQITGCFQAEMFTSGRWRHWQFPSFLQSQHPMIPSINFWWNMSFWEGEIWANSLAHRDNNLSWVSLKREISKTTGEDRTKALNSRRVESFFHLSFCPGLSSTFSETFLYSSPAICPLSLFLMMIWNLLDFCFLISYLFIKRKAITKLDSILKSGDIILLTKVQIVKAMVSLSWVLESFPDGSDSKESACNAGDLG